MIQQYKKLPYTREVIKQDDEFFIKIKELPGCFSVGKTLQEAWEMVDDALESWLEVAIEEKSFIPLPESMIEDRHYEQIFKRAQQLRKDLNDLLKKRVFIKGQIEVRKENNELKILNDFTDLYNYGFFEHSPFAEEHLIDCLGNEEGFFEVELLMHFDSGDDNYESHWEIDWIEKKEVDYENYGEMF